MTGSEFRGEVRAEIRRRLAALIEPARAVRWIGQDGALSIGFGTSEEIADAVLVALEPYTGFMAEGDVSEDDDGWITFTDSWADAEACTETGRVGVIATLWLPRVDDDAPPEEAE